MLQRSKIWCALLPLAYYACGHSISSNDDLGVAEDSGLEESASAEIGKTSQALLQIASQSFGFLTTEPLEDAANISPAATIKATIGSWNTPDSFPVTPLALFDDATYNPTGEMARYPAAGYISDFYGTEGNLAYAELREADDGWGDYQVDLFVLPSTSTSIRHHHERYRVPANDWTYLVAESTGRYSAIAFEQIQSSYFDRRTDSRTMLSSRWYDADGNGTADNQVYPAEFFAMPGDFSDGSYTFPETLPSPSTVAASDTVALEEYASHTTFDVTSSSWDCEDDGDNEDDDEDENDDSDDDEAEDEDLSEDLDDEDYCVTESGTEFYSQLQTGKYTKAFVTKTFGYEDIDLDIVAKTVRLAMENNAADKTVRAKTVQTYTYKNTSHATTITELIEIHDSDTNNRTDYDSTVAITTETQLKKGRLYTYNSTTTMDLEETGVNSHAYSGTLTITDNDGGEETYAVQLDAVSGLKLIRKIKNGSSLVKATTAGDDDDTSITIDFDYGDLDHAATAGEDNPPTLTVTTADWTLTGTLQGDILAGTITGADGSTSKIVAGTGFTLFPDASDIAEE